MNEEEVTTYTDEVSTDQTDWMEGWDTGGADYSSDAGETTETAEAESDADAETTDEAEQDGGNADAGDTAEGAEENPETAESEASQDDTLTIRYMGKNETLSRAEAIVLAQKGRNYDNIYQRMQTAEASVAENAAAVEFLKNLAAMEAKNAGLDSMSVADYMDRASLRLKMNMGLSEAQAKKEIELEKRERTLLQKEQGGQREADTQAKQATQAQRIAADKQSFQKAFPDVDIGKLPKAVWDELAKNPEQGLSVSYAKHLAKEAQAKTEEAVRRETAAEQKAAARARTPGSMRNSNPKPARSKDDELFAGWTF